MVYDWEDKEDLCYRMYIEEKKSLEEIMDYMKVEHKFAPSKRAFQTQFKRWEFPSKQHPAHKNAQLVERVKELWERNTSQREMLRILNDEDGFDIKERELMRVRAKNRWLLRVPNGMKTTKKRDSDPDQEVLSQIQQALYPNGSMVEEPEMMEETPQSMVVAPARSESPPLSPEVMQKRQDRLAKLQAESAERWSTRKRRRRTRGWAGLPADPPGPPRFPSETTIDESKAFLSLDSNMYRDVRNRFQRICEDCGIIKKTIAGPERWEAAKNSLIQESEHLQAVFWHDTHNIDQKKLALDVVCSDVTKRMRTLERRMTIAEAKNALGVNPEESRQLRNAFYQTLKADHFTSKLEAGEEHWKELKASWIENSELLKNILAPGDADPQHATKVKAMEVLCRDVMKRLRDDQTKRDPTRKKKLDPKQAAQVNQASYSTSQSAMSPMSPYEQQNNAFQTTPHAALIQTAAHAQAQVQPQAQPQQHIQHLQPPHMHHPHSQSQVQAHGQVTVDPGNMQIDPSLLVAATNDPSILHRQRHFSEQQYAGQQYAPQASFTPSASMAVYFRLHPSSDYQPNSRLWTGILHSFSINELRRAATANLPATVVAFRIEGLLTEPNGNEASLPIDQDDELTHYLTTVGKAVFVVQLVSSWKND